MVDISICIITYNQEKYIAQAIESAIHQQGNFSFEIIICDDCSTDSTTRIIQSYAIKFPQKINPHFGKKNIGMLKNWERALCLCKGKYIALLEGDDFWTDKSKLQKQFSILEKKTDYSFCFTNAKIVYENNEKPVEDYVGLRSEIHNTTNLLSYNFIPTCSVLMRNSISKNFFHPAYFKSPFADWIIHILNSKLGDFYFLNEITCTYRIHNNGLWGGINREKQLLNKLLAIECIAEIFLNSNLHLLVKKNRLETLQVLCHFYKSEKKYWDYAKYKAKLLLN